VHRINKKLKIFLYFFIVEECDYRTTKMNKKYKFFLSFLFAIFMHIITSSNTKAEDVCANIDFEEVSEERRKEVCERACIDFNQNFRWNGQWNGPPHAPQCRIGYVCGCAYNPDPNTISPDSCYARQYHCAPASTLNCAIFKNDKAKEQCKRGTDVHNPAVNCFNACTVEQQSGACQKDAPCKYLTGGMFNG
jgi:hypothetical protein